jgi:hypothetical protein
MSLSRSAYRLIALSALFAILITSAAGVTLRRGRHQRFESVPEVRGALLGKTAEEVRRELGGPDHVSAACMKHHKEVWQYDHVYREPVFVHIDYEGRVCDVRLFARAIN